MNKEKEQIKEEIVKKENLGLQTKDERDRNKSMKKENSKTIDVERLLGTYDLSKNSLATLKQKAIEAHRKQLYRSTIKQYF